MPELQTLSAAQIADLTVCLVGGRLPGDYAEQTPRWIKERPGVHTLVA